MNRQEVIDNLNFLISFISSNIGIIGRLNYNTIIDSRNESINGLCDLINLLARRNIGNIDHPSKLIDIIDKFKPSIVGNWLYWFPSNDFVIRLSFLKHCKEIIENDNSAIDNTFYYYKPSDTTRFDALGYYNNPINSISRDNFTYINYYNQLLLPHNTCFK